MLPNGLRLLTERMPHVRSVSIGVWLARGSRHEPVEQSGIAHFVEHMLFKGTATRSAEDIAQTIDSIGGQMDAFTAKEYASYYIKVLDEHLPLAVDVLSDIVMRPAFSADDIEREKKVVVEEIKMVEDTPDDLVHELFTERFWADHPLGRPILGTQETVEALSADGLRRYFTTAYSAPNLIVAAVGNIEHDAGARPRGACVRGAADRQRRRSATEPPRVVPHVLIRNKELEQSHVCLGTSGYQQDHEDRYASYVLNTVLGGSMSSRLFQNVREKRGLAYAVFSGLSAYRDAGSVTIYAGCANNAVGELIDVVIAELRRLKDETLPESELRRAKDHLKGSLMLNLESTSSRMSHLARQEIYFDRQFGLDETLEGVERVTLGRRAARGAGSVRRSRARRDGAWRRQRPAAAAGEAGTRITVASMIGRYTSPEMGRIWSDQRKYETWLQVETAAADAMARAGIVPVGGGARHPGTRPVRHRAHRGNRAGHPARRHRLYHRRGRARRSFRAVASLRPDLLRRHRHRAGAADARGLRPDPDGSRPPDAGGPGARRRASPDADDRPNARRARRADDVRPEAGAVVRGAGEGCGPRAPCPRDDLGRQAFGRRRHVRPPAAGDRSRRLPHASVSSRRRWRRR